MEVPIQFLFFGKVKIAIHVTAAAALCWIGLFQKVVNDLKLFTTASPLSSHQQPRRLQWENGKINEHIFSSFIHQIHLAFPFNQCHPLSVTHILLLLLLSSNTPKWNLRDWHGCGYDIQSTEIISIARSSFFGQNNTPRTITVQVDLYVGLGGGNFNVYTNNNKILKTPSWLLLN